jgi:cytosine/adenosine deaminase-related metal-dependent hydrolase
LAPQSYKGFEITVRSYQIRGTGRWTLDLLISHAGTRRAFSAETTYPSEALAATGCLEYGRRIIDGKVRDCSVAELL